MCRAEPGAASTAAAELRRHPGATQRAMGVPMSDGPSGSPFPPPDLDPLLSKGDQPANVAAGDAPAEAPMRRGRPRRAFVGLLVVTAVLAGTLATTAVLRSGDDGGTAAIAPGRVPDVSVTAKPPSSAALPSPVLVIDITVDSGGRQSSPCSEGQPSGTATRRRRCGFTPDRTGSGSPSRTRPRPGVTGSESSSRALPAARSRSNVPSDSRALSPRRRLRRDAPARPLRLRESGTASRRAEA